MSGVEQWEICKGKYGKDHVEFTLHGIIIRLPCNPNAVDQSERPRLILEVKKNDKPEQPSVE